MQAVTPSRSRPRPSVEQRTVQAEQRTKKRSACGQNTCDGVQESMAALSCAEASSAGPTRESDTAWGAFQSGGVWGPSDESDIDECRSSPCQNGGTCASSGLEGNLANVPPDTTFTGYHPPLPNATNPIPDDAYFCACLDGWDDW